MIRKLLNRVFTLKKGLAVLSVSFFLVFFPATDSIQAASLTCSPTLGKSSGHPFLLSSVTGRGYQRSGKAENLREEGNRRNETHYLPKNTLVTAEIPFRSSREDSDELYVPVKVLSYPDKDPDLGGPLTRAPLGQEGLLYHKSLKPLDDDLVFVVKERSRWLPLEGDLKDVVVAFQLAKSEDDHYLFRRCCKPVFDENGQKVFPSFDDNGEAQILPPFSANYQGIDPEKQCMKKYVFEAIGRDGNLIPDRRVEKSVLACDFMGVLEPMDKELFKPLNRVVAMMNDSVISPNERESEPDDLSRELPYEFRPLDVLDSIRPTPDRSQLMDLDTFEIYSRETEFGSLARFPIDVGEVGPLNTYKYKSRHPGTENMHPLSMCAFTKVLREFKKFCDKKYANSPHSSPERSDPRCEVQLGHIFSPVSRGHHTEHGRGTCVDIRPFQKQLKKTEDKTNLEEGVPWVTRSSAVPSYISRVVDNGESRYWAIIPPPRLNKEDYNQELTREFARLAIEAGAEVRFSDPSFKDLHEERYSFDGYTSRGRAYPRNAHVDHLHICFPPYDAGPNPTAEELKPLKKACYGEGAQDGPSSETVFGN
jgi:hypothetical protein